MPIHINLLAEAQIAEDLRRRDPVKRAIYFGAFLIVLALVWSSSLQLEVVINRSDLEQMQTRIATHNTEWQGVVANQKKINDVRSKLTALQQLTAARFLQGNLLNGMQQLAFDGVQVTRIRVDQTYNGVPATASTSDNGRTTPGRPATTAEKIVLTFDARDESSTPGDQVNKFKDAMGELGYFKNLLNKTNGVLLTSLSPAQIAPDGKACVLFTLECDLPQQTR